MRMRYAAIAVVSLAFAAVPAGATTFCVADPACVGIPATDVASGLSMAAAAVGTDRVQVGPGTFTSPAGGFVTSQPDPVELVGAGTGLTVLTVPAGATATTDLGPVVDIQGTGARSSTFAALTIRIPLGRLATGLTLRGGTAAGIRVETSADPPGGGHVGVRMLGASTLRDSTVELALDGAGGVGASPTGVQIEDTTGPVILRSSISAFRAVVVLRASATVRLLRAEAFATGLQVTNGSLTVDGALVRVNGPPSLQAIGLWARSTGLLPAGPAADTFLVARHVTVIGGGVNHLGLVAESFQGNNVSLSMSDSVVAGFGTAIRQFAEPGHTADVAVRFSDLFAPTLQQSSGPGGVTLSSVISQDPGFAGAFHPAAGSPLIDAGDPAGLLPDESTTDLDGAARIIGGRRDMGAFEFTPPPGASGGPAPAATLAPVPLLRSFTVTSRRIQARCRAARTRAPAVARKACAVASLVRFRLAVRSRIRVIVRRAGRSKALRTTAVTRGPGRVTLRIPVVSGRSRLDPGAYRVTIIVTGVNGQTTRRIVRLTVIPSP